MLEQMRTKKSIGLPIVAGVSVALGAAISGFVLSLSPAAGVGVIFGVSALIFMAVEISAYFRRNSGRSWGLRPHLLALSADESRKRSRKKSRGQEPIEAKADQPDYESWDPVAPQGHR
jgi:hypothetical protein